MRICGRRCLQSQTCQNMILSGSTSEITRNVYRYYDRTINTVIQQERENANKTIAHVAVEAGLSVASVSHYLLETVLKQDKPITSPLTQTFPKSSKGQANDYFARFTQLKRLVKGESVHVGGNQVTVEELPRLIVFYADDLDALGHNFEDAYGIRRAETEAGRMENVLARLEEMDQELGEFIQACKDAGIYERMTFFLTTDHGMTPYGLKSLDDSGDYGTSKLGDLQTFFQNHGHVLEMVAPGSSQNRERM